MRDDFWKKGILTAQETAAVLGYPESQLPVAARINVLRPLGWPLPPGAPYLYARVAVERLTNSEEGLEKLRRATIRYWSRKNSSRKIATKTSRANSPLTADNQGPPAANGHNSRGGGSDHC